MINKSILEAQRQVDHLARQHGIASNAWLTNKTQATWDNYREMTRAYFAAIAWMDHELSHPRSEFKPEQFAEL